MCISACDKASVPSVTGEGRGFHASDVSSTRVVLPYGHSCLSWYAWSIGQSLFDCLDELHAEDKCYCMHFIFPFWSDLRLEQNMRQKTWFWFVRIQLRSQK